MRVRFLFATAAALCSVLILPTAATAAGSGGDPAPPIVINPGQGNHGGIGIGVHAPGRPGAPGGSRPPGSTGGSGDGSGSVAPVNVKTPCGALNAAALSPAAYRRLARGLNCSTYVPLPGPGGGGAPAPPDPALLAQAAYGELQLPSPTIERSPDQDNADPAFGGQSYTWVNLWTWYWTDPGTWRQLGKTVAAGGVSATVTARPVSLTFDPGDGSAAVSCDGPGRPWTTADGNAAPAGGGCGYEYRHVTTGSTPLTATVSIVWSVSWTSNVGKGGVLPQMATQAASSFLVEQIHDVNR